MLLNTEENKNTISHKYDVAKIFESVYRYLNAYVADKQKTKC